MNTQNGRPRGGDGTGRQDASAHSSLRLDLVDGPRPAVEWVCRIPPDWTTPRERLVLLLLALDTYAQEPPFTCAPKLDDLANWSGEYKGRISEAVAALEHASGTRPALLDVVRGAGRRRTTYRLMVENGPALWSGTADHYDPDEHGPSGPAQRTTTHVEDSVEKPRSGPASGPASGPVLRTTPFPSLDAPPTARTEVQVRAREDLGAGDEIRQTLQLLADFAQHPVDSALAAVTQQLAQGWRPHQLADAVRGRGNLNGSTSIPAVIRRRVEDLGPPPPKPTTKCGACDANRMVEMPDGRAARCGTCHPQRTRQEASA